MSEKWIVGDRVAIRGVRMDRDTLAITTIARVLKTFVETDGGAKFDHNGSVYPRREWTTTRLLRLTPELEAEARRQQAIRFLSVRKWNQFDTETLEKVVAVVKAATKVS